MGRKAFAKIVREQHMQKFLISVRELYNVNLNITVNKLL